MSPTAAIYCRVSTEDQADEGTSLETQRLDGLALAVKLGCDVPDEFVIQDVKSGSKFDDRVGIQLIKRLIQEGRIDVLIAQKVDRISRSPMHFYTIYDLAQRHGVRLEWTDQTFANSPDGQMLLGLMVVFAQRELELIKERTQSGVTARVERDRRPLPGPRPPFGYRWLDDEKTRLAPDPVTGPLWAGVLQELASGATARSIATRLNNQGVPTPSAKPGAKWTSANISKMASHPAYFGEWVVWRRSRNAERRQQATVPGVITEPLIDLATWTAIQTRMTLNKSEASRNNARPFEALLRAGIARCGYCGNSAQAVNVKIRSGYKRCYICNKANAARHKCPSYYLNCDDLDENVWAVVRALLNDPTLVERQLREQEAARGPKQIDVTPITRHIDALMTKQARLLDEISNEDDGEVRKAIKGRLSELIANEQEARRQLNALREQQDAYLRRDQTLNSMVEVMTRFNEKLELEATYEVKRAALLMLGVRVDLFNKKDVPERWRLSYDLIDGDSIDNSLSRKVICDSHPQGCHSQQLEAYRVELTRPMVTKLLELMKSK